MAGAGAGQPISFCNVFSFSSLLTGLVILFRGRRGTMRRIPFLTPTDRRLVVAHRLLADLVQQWSPVTRPAPEAISR